LNGSSNHYDFIIIGGGIAGLSAAYFLSQQARVVVLEKEAHCGYHSSGRSAAVFIEAYENAPVCTLTQTSKPFFLTPPDGFTDYPLMHVIGGLTVIKPDQERAAQDYLEQWSELCPHMARIDIEDMCGHVPLLRRERMVDGIFDPLLHAIDANQLLQSYRRSIKRRGGQIITGVELDSARYKDNIWRCGWGAESASAPVLINAAGAWANTVAEQCGVTPMPLTPCRRSAAVIPAPPEAASWPMVRSLEGELYFKPEQPGLMVSPQDETPSPACDAHPDDMDLAIALERFQEVCSLPIQRIHRSWAGLRTLTPDRLPIIGPATPEEHFFWLAGQGGFGVQTSPGIGQLVAATLLDQQKIPAELQAKRFS